MCPLQGSYDIPPFPVVKLWLAEDWLHSGICKDCPTLSYALPQQHSPCLPLPSLSQAHWDPQELSTLIDGGCTPCSAFINTTPRGVQADF